MLAITPIKFGFNNKINQQNSNPYQPRTSNLAPLNKDIVSFGNISRVLAKSELKSATFADAYVVARAEEIKTRLNRISNTFHAALRDVALDIKGVKYDPDYNAKSPIKSTEAILEKLVRKDGPICDEIRGTEFIDNPYDLNILKKTLKKLEEDFGYVLAPHPTEKGLKDLDIRLNKDDLKEQTPDFMEIIEELKGEFSGPQKSGYEDIQLRLIRTHEKKKKDVEKTKHELIALFGPQYAKMKEIESKWIYSNLRKFDELDIIKNKKNQHNSHAKKYVTLINSLFQNRFTNILYLNGKSKSYKHGTKLTMPVAFSKQDKALLDTSFAELKSRLARYHSGPDSEAKKLDFQKLEQIKNGLNDAVKYFTSDEFAKLIQ